MTKESPQTSGPPPPTTFPALPRLKAKEQVLTRNTRKRDFDLHGNEYTQDDEIPFSLIVMTKRFEDQSWYREWKVTMDRVVTARMALDTIKPDAPERPPADREYEAALAAFRLLAEKHR